MCGNGDGPGLEGNPTKCCLRHKEMPAGRHKNDTPTFKSRQRLQGNAACATRECLLCHTKATHCHKEMLLAPQGNACSATQMRHILTFTSREGEQANAACATRKCTPLHRPDCLLQGKDMSKAKRTSRAKKIPRIFHAQFLFTFLLEK